MPEKWTGEWEVPMVSFPSWFQVGGYVVHITGHGNVTFEGMVGADGKILARDGRFFVASTPPSTAYSGQGQRRVYVPAKHRLFEVFGVVESRDGLDVVLAKVRMSWSPRPVR